MVRKIFKALAALSPVALTKNEYYDRLTEKVIKATCNTHSVCVDVGAHNGKILAMFIKHCPAAMHYAFEPLPHLYKLLVRKYGSACKVYQVALSNFNGASTFNYVTTKPAYSGLLKIPFPGSEKEENIPVQCARLDDIIEPSDNITLLKFDIEGGEYHALQGAEKLIDTCRPYLLFEFGRGGSDVYGISTQTMFKFFSDHAYSVYTLSAFLAKNPPLSLSRLQQYYQTGNEYFFIASPISPVNK